jgi:hypothetical protein
LALRNDDGPRHDFLLTDPPGEWFGVWAHKEDAEQGEGARWIYKYADRFVLLVDRDALSSTERGRHREAVKSLARRLGPGLGNRPIAVVWTKSDKAVPAGIESDLENCFRAEFPEYAAFRVRMRFGNEQRAEVEEPCISLMNWLFTDRKPGGSGVRIPSGQPSDFFMAYRGRT